MVARRSARSLPVPLLRSPEDHEQVIDEASEDFYEFLDTVGKRDAGEALKRLERLFSGREIRAGQRSFDPEDGWPQIFLGMLTGELRRMLLIRAQMEEPGARAPDPRSDYRAYKAVSRASRYTVRELARALAGAAELDVKLKNSAPELESFTAFVAGLIAGS